MSNKDLLIDLANEHNINTDHYAGYLEWLRFQMNQEELENTVKTEIDVVDLETAND